MIIKSCLNCNKFKYCIIQKKLIELLSYYILINEEYKTDCNVIIKAILISLAKKCNDYEQNGNYLDKI